VEGARRLLVDGKWLRAVLDSALPQSKIEINGQAIHFVHIRPEHSSAAPLLVAMRDAPAYLRAPPDATRARVARIVTSACLPQSCSRLRAAPAAPSISSALARRCARLQSLSVALSRLHGSPFQL
jgi:hypothetical protein